MRASVAGAVLGLFVLGIWGCVVRVGDRGKEETRTCLLYTSRCV